MSTGRVPGPLTLLARRHGLVRSPLRRTTDRWEGASGPTPGPGGAIEPGSNE
jgi:hypothetical protein